MPSQYFSLDRQERAFIIAAIEIYAEQKKREEQELKKKSSEKAVISLDEFWKEGEMLRRLEQPFQIYDGVTRPLQSMHRAMNIVLNSFEAMQRASSNAIDVASIQEAREELARAGAAFDEIEQNIRNAGTQQSRFNRRIRDGSNEADGLYGQAERHCCYDWRFGSHKESRQSIG